MKNNSSKQLSAKSRLVPAGVTNLYRDRFTNIYYGRAKINGTSASFSLDTDKRDGENGALVRLATELDKRRREAACGIKANGELTLGECLARHVANQEERLQLHKICPATLRAHKSAVAAVEQHFGAGWKDFQVRKLANNFLPFRKKYLAFYDNFASATVNAVRTVLVGAFQLAVDDKVLVSNPADALPSKSKNLDKKREVPSVEDVNELFQWLNTPRKGWWKPAADLVQFLCLFGCRIHEANALLKSDVDLDPKREGTKEWSPAINFRVTKSRAVNRRSRRVPIFPDALPLVRRLLANQKSGDALLLTKSCDNALRAAAKTLKQPVWGHHTFRHVFATRALEATQCDYFTVSKWLGHSDGGHLLAKLYAHLNEKHSQAQAQKVTWEFAKGAEFVEDVKPDAAAAQIAALEKQLAALRAQAANPGLALAA